MQVFFAALLFSLCARYALRAALPGVMNERKCRFALLLALLLSAGGAVGSFFFGRDLHLSAAAFFALGVGCCAEYCANFDEKTAAVLSEVLLWICLCAAWCLTDEPLRARLLAAVGAAFFAVNLLMALLPFKKGAPVADAALLKYIPMGLLRGAPLVLLTYPVKAPAAVLAAYILFEGTRSPRFRAQNEAFVPILSAFGALLLSIDALFVPILRIPALGLLCGCFANGLLSPRTMVPAALTALLPLPWMPIGATVNLAAWFPEMRLQANKLRLWRMKRRMKRAAH